MRLVRFLAGAAAIGVLVLALVGCAFPTSTPGNVVHKLVNSTIDPQISDAANISYAGYDPAVQQNALLLLFLGGTASSPSGYQLYSEEALKEGYHVLDLDYLDATSVGNLCLDDLSCYGAVRQEIVTGSDSSNLVNVAPADSILNRVSKDLAYLSTTYASEGWSSFLNGGQIAWGTIVVSGFSQGAGHALWIVQHYPAKGAILFSGPVDGRVDSPYQSANWISTAATWATPRSSLRFFVSSDDGYYPAIRANLVTLGFDPSSVGISIDNGAPSAAGHPLLLTNKVAANAHPSVVEDGATPLLSNGTALYAPDWDYLLRSF